MVHQEIQNGNADFSNKVKGNVPFSPSYQYNLAGLRTKVTLENGDYINYAYDVTEQLISETKKKKESSNRIYYSYLYEFDPVGNRTKMTRDLHQKPVFAQGEAKGGKGEAKRSEVPSDDGNKTKPSFWNLPGHSDFEYTYNEENQLTQVRIIRGGTTFIADYQYDNNGNLISKQEYEEDDEDEAEITTYAYDFENRLTKITYPAERSGVPTNVGNATTSEYIYDGVGKRIQSIENGEITKYLYDGLSVIIERDGLDNTIVTYTRGLSYGGGIGGVISRETKDSQRKTHYYHYDGLGTVTGLTDQQGNLVQSYQYDAFGNLLSSIGAETNSYQFSTKEFSPESSLIYFGARYYSPRMGRFITKDIWPANLRIPSSLNRYLYVANNPANWIDLWGFQRLSKEDYEKIRQLYEDFQDVGNRIEDMRQNWKPGQTWKDYGLSKLADAAGYRAPEFYTYPQAVQNAVNYVEDNYYLNWGLAAQLVIIGGHGYWNPLNWVFRQSGYAESQWWLFKIVEARFKSRLLLSKLQKILGAK